MDGLEAPDPNRPYLKSLEHVNARCSRTALLGSGGHQRAQRAPCQPADMQQ